MHSTRASSTTSVRAFTIFEVAIASVVVLVAVVGLIQVVTIGSEMQDVARKQTVAMQIIRNEIDGVHLKDWTTVSAMPQSPATPWLLINNAGTGLLKCGTTAAHTTINAAAETAFALTNYTNSYTPPYTNQSNDDNVNLMGQAKGFTCTLTITPMTGRTTTFLILTYTVSWTSSNRLKTYTRSGTTYYSKYGLNVYYRR